LIEGQEPNVLISWGFYDDTIKDGVYNKARIKWGTGDIRTDDPSLLLIGDYPETSVKETVADFFIYGSSYTITGQNIEVSPPYRESAIRKFLLIMPTPTPTVTPTPTNTPVSTPTATPTPIQSVGKLIFKAGSHLYALIKEDLE